MKAARALLCWSLASAGCGREPHRRIIETDDGRLENRAYTLVEPGSLRSNGYRIWGSGSFVVVEPLPEVHGTSTYHFGVRLGPQSAVTFVTHASATLEQGIELEVRQEGATLRHPGGEEDVSDALAPAVREGEIAFCTYVLKTLAREAPAWSSGTRRRLTSASWPHRQLSRFSTPQRAA